MAGPRAGSMLARCSRCGDRNERCLSASLAPRIPVCRRRACRRTGREDARICFDLSPGGMAGPWAGAMLAVWRPQGAPSLAPRPQPVVVGVKSSRGWSMAAQDGRCDSCGCLLFCSRRVQDWTRRDEAGGVATARATFLAAAVLHARGAAVCAGACSMGDAGCEMVRLRSAVSHVRYGRARGRCWQSGGCERQRPWLHGLSWRDRVADRRRGRSIGATTYGVHVCRAEWRVSAADLPHLDTPPYCATL
jgi:hypothetical protein